MGANMRGVSWNMLKTYGLNEIVENAGFEEIENSR